MSEPLEGTVIGIVVGENVHASDVMRARYRLHELGAKVQLVGMEEDSVRGTDGATFPVEAVASDISPGYYDGLVVPSGIDWAPGAGHRALVTRVRERRIPVALVGDGVRLAIDAGLVMGRAVSAGPELADEIERAGGHVSSARVQATDILLSAADGADIDALCAAFAEAVSERRRDAVDERVLETFPGSDSPASTLTT
jgi:protease I